MWALLVPYAMRMNSARGLLLLSLLLGTRAATAAKRLRRAWARPAAEGGAPGTTRQLQREVALAHWSTGQMTSQGAGRFAYVRGNRLYPVLLDCPACNCPGDATSLVITLIENTHPLREAESPYHCGIRQRPGDGVLEPDLRGLFVWARDNGGGRGATFFVGGSSADAARRYAVAATDCAEGSSGCPGDNLACGAEAQQLTRRLLQSVGLGRPPHLRRLTPPLRLAYDSIGPAASRVVRTSPPLSPRLSVPPPSPRGFTRL